MSLTMWGMVFGEGVDPGSFSKWQNDALCEFVFGRPVDDSQFLFIRTMDAAGIITFKIREMALKESGFA